MANMDDTHQNVNALQPETALEEEKQLPEHENLPETDRGGVVDTESFLTASDQEAGGKETAAGLSTASFEELLPPDEAGEPLPDDDLPFSAEAEEEAGQLEDEFDQDALILTEYHCANCQEVVLALPEFPLLGCMFCSSSFEEVDPAHVLLWQPDAIVPFTVDKGLFFETVLRWISDGELTPDDIFREVYFDLTEELYLPFYLFEGDYTSSYSASVGTEVYDEDSKTTSLEWEKTAGEVEGSFSVLQYGGFASLPEDMIEFLENMPIDASMVEQFGKFAIEASVFRPFDLDADTLYDQKTADRLVEKVQQDVVNTLNSQHIDELALTPVIERSVKSLYLPVWLLSYRYKEEMYYAAVDGILPKKAKKPRIHGSKPQDAYREMLLGTLSFPLKLWSALGAVLVLVILFSFNLSGWWQFIVVVGYLAFVLGYYRKIEVRRANILKESREKRNALLRHLHQKCVSILTSTWRAEVIDKMRSGHSDFEAEVDADIEERDDLDDDLDSTEKP